jgi:hypothetical protein
MDAIEIEERPDTRPCRALLDIARERAGSRTGLGPPRAGGVQALPGTGHGV